MLKWLLVFFLFCTPSFAQNNPGVIVKGTVTPNNCPKFLNAWTLEDSGTTCGGGSGTVSTGTAGNIAFYQSTGSTVIGTSAIDINTSTWNVGIGTATPAYSLTVVGTSAATAFLANGVTPPSLSRNGLFGGNGTLGGILAGYGSTADVTLENRNYIPALEIPANTNNVDILQTLEVGAGIGVGTATPQSKIHVLNGEVQVGTSGNACASNNAGAISYNGGLNYCNGTAWTAASPPQGNIYNVISYGADNTGTVASDAAIISAMTACNAASIITSGTGTSSVQAGGTVYFPGGKYKIATGFAWQSGCNIRADQSSYIQASTSITDIIHAPSSITPIQDVNLDGGTWDCNNNATNGFTIPQFARVRIQNITMYNCTLANGGFISLGTSNVSLTNAYEMHVTTSHFYNIDNQTPASANYGIYTPSGAYAANSDFLQLEIVGNQYGVFGDYPSSEFEQVHVWGFTIAGGFNLSGSGPVRLSQIEVDGPLQANGNAYTLLGSNNIYELSQIEFDNVGNDNVGTAVSIGTGARVLISGAHFHGQSGQRIAHDFIGDLTGLTTAAIDEDFVVSKVINKTSITAADGIAIGTQILANFETGLTVVNSGGLDASFFQTGAISGGAQINTAASYSSTVPIYSFWFNDSTGFGNPSANVISGIVNGAEVMRVTSSGILFGTTSNPNSYPLIISSNTSGNSSVGVVGATNIQILGADGGPAGIITDAFGGNNFYYGRRADGTNGSPSALQSGEDIMILGGRGYETSQYSSGTPVSIHYQAAANWTNSSAPTQMTFNTAQSGATLATLAMEITDQQFVGIGTSNPGALFTVGNNVFEVNSSGAVGAGIWQATAVGTQYGGTNAVTVANAVSNLFANPSSGNYAINCASSTSCTTVAMVSAGVTTISAGTTGLLPSSPTAGDVVLSGKLIVANGGTGDATFTSNGVLYGNTTGALQVTNQGGANTILTANGGAPSFSATPIIGTSLGIGTATISASNVLEINGSATIGYVDLAAPATGLAIKGNVNIGTTSNPNGYPLLVNTNITGIPPSSATGTTPVQLVAVDGNVAMYDAHAFAANTSFYGWRADGTNRSPSAVQSGEDILILGGRGYEASQYSTGTPISIHYQAGGNWTNSSAPTQMTFNTTPSGATSASLAMEITSSGSIQMPLLASSSAGTTGTVCWATSTGNLTVDTTTTCLLSSLRFKKDIIPMENALSDIMKMKPITFVYKDKAMGTDRLSGLIAEDVLPIDRTLVELDKDGKAYKIRYEGLSAKNTRAIQQIQDEIQSLKQFPVISHRCVSWLPIMCGG